MNFSDFSSPEFYKNPYPLYKAIRDKGALVPIAPNIYVSGHYAVVEGLLLDRRMGKTYIESIVARYGEEGRNQPIFQSLSRMFLMMNPPAHTRLRSLLMKAFSARQVEKFRQATNKTANDLLDQLQARDRFDLISEYASPLPIEIICRLLNISREDGIRLSEEASLLPQALDAAPLDAARLAETNRAVLSLEKYFTEVVRERRCDLGDDLISALIEAEEGGERLTEDEVVSNVLLLFVGGHETTSNMIGNALITLHQHPSQLDELRNNLELMPQAVNECMRYDSSVQLVTRTAFEDIELAGAAVPRGSMIFLMLGAANRDPSQFENADKFDIHRVTEGRQISFGGGIHFCLGSRLATLEIGIGISTLLSRLPTLRISNLDDLQWRPRNNLRGVAKLNALTSAARS